MTSSSPSRVRTSLVSSFGHIFTLKLVCLSCSTYLSLTKVILRSSISNSLNMLILRLLGLGQEHARGLRAFGNLRNEFAHKLDSKLSKGRIKSLYEAFSALDKKVVQLAYVRTKSQLGGLGGQDATFKDLDPKNQFILIAVALHGMLEVAISEIRKRQVSFHNSGKDAGSKHGRSEK